ncbi:hypothetical protein Slin15195_G056310 [Septoria linicola]|uniref:F-box domain-containing protein n=1 Tax=Septoria linicola TaxID=215465 RepID=A0A9Q9AMQ7_9PEZI|nr:hypothetical protein Slin14017_G072190 [Septoria linicola]USW52312.1 hypothetical protein Slin15195_G056310 [Septoria linicola]
MFKRFRRASKTTQPATKDDHQQRSSIATTPIKKTTFFDLPAELRNEIYELTADNTTLRITALKGSSKTTKQQQDEAIPGLLIASRQCRAEYLPILLATSPIEISVKNFDFSNITRITGSLYSTELKALRANEHLTLRLTFSSSSTGSRGQSLESSLRTWVTRRSAGMDRLPWHYALPLRDRMPRASGHTAFMIDYQKCMSTLRMLHAKVDEALQWELQIMMNELEVQDEVSGEYWRNRYAEYQVAKVRGWV